MFPVWFYQGMERMKYISYLNIVAKVIFTVAIFIFVKDQNDFYLVPFFTSFGFIVVGIWSLWIIYKEFGIRFKVQSLEILKYYFFDGWYLFKTRIFVSIYTITNIFLLGLLTNNIVVGYYSIAERIIGAIGGLFIPANQAMYPFMTKLYEESKDRFIKFLRKISLIYVSVSLSLFILIYFFSDTIIILVNGTMSSDISSIYFILIFLIFTSPFGTLYAQVMVIESKNKKISEIVRDIAVLNIIFVPIGIYFWGAVGMALVVVLLQYFIVLRYYITINKGM
jgi:PST family polysaccharide transporter